jgi:hypothetical protein
MGKPRDHTDATQDIARDLADIAGQLAALKGEAALHQNSLVHKNQRVCTKIFSAKQQRVAYLTRGGCSAAAPLALKSACPNSNQATP